MSIANVITRGGPSVSSKARIAFVVTHGLGNYAVSPSTGGAALHRMKRGQAGTVMRGRLGTGGAH